MNTRIERGGIASALGLIVLGLGAYLVWAFVTSPEQWIWPAAIIGAIALLVAWKSESGRELMSSAAGGAMRGAGSMARRSTSMARSPGDDTSEERRFRVVDQQGRAFDCLMVGELTGGTLKPGDDVQIWGHFDRRRLIRVRKVVIVATGATVTAKLHLAVLLRRANRWIVRLLLIGLVVYVVRQVAW